jgi:hypothetical protein
MKKVFLASLLAFLLGSCSTEESLNSEDVNLQKTSSSIDDPVIEAYQAYGNIYKASSSYSPSNANCLDADAVYIFTPDDGPNTGEEIEIYRFTDLDDIDISCGIDFNLKAVREPTYVYCDTDGSECAEEEVNGRCLYIFCDETELL